MKRFHSFQAWITWRSLRHQTRFCFMFRRLNTSDLAQLKETNLRLTDIYLDHLARLRLDDFMSATGGFYTRARAGKSSIRGSSKDMRILAET